MTDWILGVIVAVVVGALIYTMVQYSTGRGKEPEPSDPKVELTFNENNMEDDPTLDYEHETYSSTDSIKFKIVPDHISEIENITEINGIGEAKAKNLREFGFLNPADVYFATDKQLMDVDGIGPVVVDQIRDDIDYHIETVPEE